MRPIQPDPRYFNFGGAFQNGMQRAEENQRRNALLDMDKQDFSNRQQTFANQQQDRAAQQQQYSREQKIDVLTKALGVYAANPQAFGEDQVSQIRQGLDELIMPGAGQGLSPETAPQYLSVFGVKPDGVPSRASSIQEYEAAKETGFGGSFLDFQRAQSAATRAPQTGPAAPSGYTYVSPNQLAPIPGGPADKPQAPDLSPAQKAVDTNFAKEYVAFINGGAADASKAVEELSEAVKRLGSGKENLTGPVIGSVPKFAKDIVAPAASDVQETVESTVQRSLRAILGAQFTEKEGERLISRAYNPSLPEATNKKRVQRLVTQLERALRAKQQAAAYYEKNGTLQGFDGQYNFGLGDFNPDVAEEAKPRVPASGSAAPQGIDPKIWAAMTPEERALWN